jgi:hypothetical protein
VNVTIDAVAGDDANGTVKKVAFFANGISVGTSTAAPFSVPWSPSTVGKYVLTATATDNLDATATSAPVSVTVVKPNVPPTVSLTSPAAGASFQLPATIAIGATAGDSDGSVTSVAFYANGVPIGSDSASPFATSWTPAAAGDYMLTAGRHGQQRRDDDVGCGGDYGGEAECATDRVPDEPGRRRVVPTAGDDCAGCDGRRHRRVGIGRDLLREWRADWCGFR